MVAPAERSMAADRGVQRKRFRFAGNDNRDHRLSLIRMGEGMGVERKPAEVFPPGEYLRDELEERGWSQLEFAEIIGRPVRVVNEIIAGKVLVTPKTATEIG